MKAREFSTQRLTLRLVEQAILSYRFFHDSDEELMSFLGLKTHEELAKERVKFEGGLATHNKKFLYFMLLESNSDKVIGWCGFHTWYTDHFRAEIGYGLFEEKFKQQGLMTEAMVFIVPFGFDVMKLTRIEAFIGSDNDASIRLARKFGFQKEGLLRGHYYNKGIAEDSEVFGLLKNEMRLPIG